MDLNKIAAIDIGSNAIRLLITNVIIKKGFPIKFIKSSIVRVPIGLGQESFRIHSFIKSNIWTLLPSGKLKFKKGSIVDCFFPHHSNKTF